MTVTIQLDNTSTRFVNSSIIVENAQMTQTPLSAVSASFVSSTETGIFTIEVRRTDTRPLRDIDVVLSIPASHLLCTTVPESQIRLGGVPWFSMRLAAPPPALPSGDRDAIASISPVSTNLQVIAAVGLLRCSPGATFSVETEAGVRALVPMALSGTCRGAVQGALLAISLAFVLNLLLTILLKVLKGINWFDAAAISQFPGATLFLWGFLQMGLVVCGGRLMTNIDDAVGNYSVKDAHLGQVGVVLGVAVPFLYIAVTWAFVSRRCYHIRETTPPAASTVEGEPQPQPLTEQPTRLNTFIVETFVPKFELDMSLYPSSKAYSFVVGWSRFASSLWVALPTTQPMLMLFVVFVYGEACEALLTITGLFLVAVGVICYIIARPYRTTIDNYVQGVAVLVNGAILFIAAKLVTDPTSRLAKDANRALSFVQMALSFLQGGFSVYSFYFMMFRRPSRFERVGALLVSGGDYDVTNMRFRPEQPPSQQLNRGDASDEEDHFSYDERPNLSALVPVFERVAFFTVCSGGSSHYRSVGAHNDMTEPLENSTPKQVADSSNRENQS